MALVSGTTAVPLGAVGLTVTGQFASSYQVSATSSATTPGWFAEIDITDKQPTQFSLIFSVPAPANAFIDWTVVGTLVGSAGQSTLQDYLDEVRRLLHDEVTSGTGTSETGQLYNTTDLIAWINRAITQRDMDLGMNKAVVSFTLSTGVSRYPIESILGSGTILMGPPTPNVIDVIGAIVVPIGSAPGGIRYPLNRWPYSKLAYLLSTSYPTYPVVYAVYGSETIVLAPPPAANYPIEFDFKCYTPPLLARIDADPLPYPWTDPVPFLAASFAKVGAQRYDEAREFNNPDPRAPGLYQQRMNMVRAQGRPFAVRDAWSDLPRAMR